MARWNFCFKFWAPLLVALAARNVRATQIQALYTAACQRQVGIILDVTPREVKLLDLAGQVKTLRRYEIIYYATFLIDTVPIAEVRDPSQVPMLEIKTLEGNALVKLVRGWPVDFSKDKIAVLDEHGTEVLIDRARIWRLDFQTGLTPFRFSHAPTSRYAFAHPYAFSSCPLDQGGGKNAGVFTVYPQQLMNDPVSIKRELDRFAEGHAQVRQYEIDQDFYARPEIYENDTQLGLWLSAGSRYGASRNRSNNFTPYLVNHFSSGPFGFQSELKTGSGPLAQTIHEEAQTQFYYRLKADYFHFAGMADPNLLLVGQKYEWARDDLSANDIRANETAFMEFGFDYGRFSLELYPVGAMNMAAQTGAVFRQKNTTLLRAGVRWQGYHWSANLIAGVGHEDDGGSFGTTILRANVEWTQSAAQRYEVSLIQRQLSLNGRGDKDGTHLNVTGDALTLAAYGHLRFKKRYWAGAMLAAESLKVKYGLANADQSVNRLHPKAGVLISLSF